MKIHLCGETCVAIARVCVATAKWSVAAAKVSVAVARLQRGRRLLLF
jgi:hypothetical protein